VKSKINKILCKNKYKGSNLIRQRGFFLSIKIIQDDARCWIRLSTEIYDIFKEFLLSMINKDETSPD